MDYTEVPLLHTAIQEYSHKFRVACDSSEEIMIVTVRNVKKLLSSKAVIESTPATSWSLGKGYGLTSEGSIVRYVESVKTSHGPEMYAHLPEGGLTKVCGWMVMESSQLSRYDITYLCSVLRSWPTI